MENGIRVLYRYQLQANVIRSLHDNHFKDGGNINGRCMVKDGAVYFAAL